MQISAMGHGTAVTPQAAIQINRQRWVEAMAGASEALQVKEAEATKAKIAIVINLANKLIDDMSSKRLTELQAKDICQEIMFLVGCYRIKTYPVIRDALVDLSSMYHQNYKATKAPAGNSIQISTVSAMA